MSMMLKLTVDDHHGVLDRITGIIRRNGWNIGSLGVGRVGRGHTDISIQLENRGADVQKLGKTLSKLDFVQDWEECSAETHFIRELLVLKIREPDCTGDLLANGRIMEKTGDVLFIEYIGSPREIDELLEELKGSVIDCARTGASCILKEGGDGNE